MFASYISLGFSLFSAIVVLELAEEKKMDLVMKIHKASGVVSFILWALGIIGVLATM
jgi:hypothetical protein